MGKEYLYTLLRLCEAIKDPLSCAVFRCACRRYQAYLHGETVSKYITKTEIIDHLLSMGLMQYRSDGKRPDDRKVRQAVEELVKQGYPIIAVSRKKGYAIADKIDEINAAREENRRRGKSIFAKDGGYEKAGNLILGQTEIGA